MRTFVFISEIPDFVLQPWVNEVKRDAIAPVRPNRDPRYERLRRLLADHTSGLMLVMHLETSGYGLALYASEAEALEACKTTILPELPDARKCEGYPPPPPLCLRIVEKEKPPPLEAVYSPSIVIEGETVLKSELANTRGLELTYRGQVVPKWCSSTLEGADCLFGVSCHHIHRLAYQKTVRKRPRLVDKKGVQDLEGLSTGERRTIDTLLMNCKLAEEKLLQFRSFSIERLPSVFVPFSIAEVERYLHGSDNSDDDAVLREMTDRIERACRLSAPSLLSGSPIFPRFSFPYGSPWEWSLHCDREEGLPRLRKRCPFPPNGAPTPLERDIFTQRLFYQINQCNAFTSVFEALRVIRCSKRLRHGFEEFKCQSSRAFTRGGQASQGAPENVYLCIRPWLYLPTVGCEVEAFVEGNGRHVRGLVQRYSQLRLMLTLETLSEFYKAPDEESGTDADLNAALSRFTPAGEETEEVAGVGLLNETQRLGRCFSRAVKELREHLLSLEQLKLSSDVEANLNGPRASIDGSSESCFCVPPGAAWCVQLALVLPPPASSSAGVAAVSPSVAVLSFKPYLQALEDCPMDAHLTRPHTTASPSRGSSAELEVLWNLKKHMHIPLFPLHELEKLKTSGETVLREGGT